jgi:general secretion pathway protein A
MYCEYFGFSERPFDVTPDPRFLFLSPEHREMLASLIYGIKERRGFITIIGEVGTGKTTILNSMLDKLDKTIKVAFVFNTSVSFEQMLHLALIDLGVAKPENPLSKVEALQILNDYAIKQLSEGNNVVLVVDEAQNLDSHAMEDFRLLSNLETRKHKLIQIILSGQPELDVKLRQKELRQLAQRINLRRYIVPLDQMEMEEYIQHRLAIAGYKGKPIFSKNAIQAVWEFSGGIPRKVNVVCDNAFLIAYGLESKKITSNIIEEAVNDLNWSPYVSSHLDHGTTTLDLKPLHSTENKRDQYITSKSHPATFRDKSKGKHVRPYARIAALFIIVFIGIGIGLAIERFIPNWKIWEDRKSEDGSLQENLVENKSNGGTAGTLDVDRLISKRGDKESVEALQARENMSMGGSATAATVDDRDIIIEEAEQETRDVEWINDSEPAAKSDISEPKEAPVLGEKMQPRFRVIQQNDLLSEIIRQEYGTFNEELLQIIMENNPEISNPNQIYVGQVIVLPSLDKRNEALQNGT